MSVLRIILPILFILNCCGSKVNNMNKDETFKAINKTIDNKLRILHTQTFNAGTFQMNKEDEKEEEEQNLIYKFAFRQKFNNSQFKQLSDLHEIKCYLPRFLNSLPITDEYFFENLLKALSKDNKLWSNKIKDLYLTYSSADAVFIEILNTINENRSESKGKPDLELSKHSKEEEMIVTGYIENKCDYIVSKDIIDLVLNYYCRVKLWRAHIGRNLSLMGSNTKIFDKAENIEKLFKILAKILKEDKEIKDICFRTRNGFLYCEEIIVSENGRIILKPNRGLSKDPTYLTSYFLKFRYKKNKFQKDLMKLKLTLADKNNVCCLNQENSTECFKVIQSLLNKKYLKGFYLYNMKKGRFYFENIIINDDGTVLLKNEKEIIKYEDIKHFSFFINFVLEETIDITNKTPYTALHSQHHSSPDECFKENCFKCDHFYKK